MSLCNFLQPCISCPGSFSTTAINSHSIEDCVCIDTFVQNNETREWNLWKLAYFWINIISCYSMLFNSPISVACSCPKDYYLASNNLECLKCDQNANSEENTSNDACICHPGRFQDFLVWISISVLLGQGIAFRSLKSNVSNVNAGTTSQSMVEISVPSVKET